MKKNIYAVLLGFSLLFTLSPAKSLLSISVVTTESLGVFDIDLTWDQDVNDLVIFADHFGTNWNGFFTISRVAPTNTIEVTWQFEHLIAPHAEDSNDSGSLGLTVNNINLSQNLASSGTTVHETDQDLWTFALNNDAATSTTTLNLHIEHQNSIPLPSSILLLMLGLTGLFLRKK